MTAFKVFLRKTGETPGKEVEITPEATVSDIKGLHDLVGYTLSYKEPLKNAIRMVDIGIKALDTISVVKTAQTGLRKTESRLRNGQKKSTVYPYLNALPAQTREVVIEAVMVESELARKNANEQCTGIHEAIGNLTAAVGGTSVRAPDQTDHERRSQLQMQALVIVNECATLVASIKAKRRRKNVRRLHKKSNEKRRASGWWG